MELVKHSSKFESNEYLNIVKSRKILVDHEYSSLLNLNPSVNINYLLEVAKQKVDKLIQTYIKTLNQCQL